MLKRMVYLIFFIAVIAAVGWLSFQIYRINVLPVRVVSIKGNVPPSDEAHLTELIESSARHSLLSVGLKNIQAEIQTLPWVERAEVRRVWPDQLSIVVFNQEPVAYWNDQWLINAYGEIFSSGAMVVPDNLPKFYGNNDSTIKVLAYEQQINTMIHPLGLTITQLQVDDAGAWRAVLSTGTTLILGQEDVLERFSRLMRVYPKIFQGDKQAKTVDLRYPHGLAVKWKE